MAGTGGARQGAGRKTKTEEDRVKNLARKAIASVYGSEDKGFRFLLKSGEPSLVKYAFEHAFGKPKETIKHEGNGVQKILNVDPLSDIKDAANNSTS